MHLHKKYLKNLFMKSLQNLTYFLIFFWVNVLMFSFSDHHSDFVFHNKNMKILLMVYGMVTLKSKNSTTMSFFFWLSLSKRLNYVESKMKRFLKIGRAFSRIVLFLGRRDLSWGYCKIHSGL